MPFVEVETTSTKPWVLHCHFSVGGKEGKPVDRVEIIRCASEEGAKLIADQRKTLDGCYLIELYVDAGCLHAIG